jgi:hypothetical protein
MKENICVLDERTKQEIIKVAIIFLFLPLRAPG